MNITDLSVSQIVKDHVSFEVENIDRMYLNLILLVILIIESLYRTASDDQDVTIRCIQTRNRDLDVKPKF